jgi:hypothetical protein
MVSQFVIQVVDTETGDVVQWAPGMAVERKLIADLGARVAAKKFNLFRNPAQIAKAAQEALIELLHDLKSDVHPGPKP